MAKFLGPIGKRLPPPLRKLTTPRVKQLKPSRRALPAPRPAISTATQAISLSSIEVISQPRPELTVDSLAQKLTPEVLRGAVRILQHEGMAVWKAELDQLGVSYSFERPASTDGKPGALLKHDGKRKIGVVGDLHGNKARFDLILKGIQAKLYSGEAELIFLGDLIHPESGTADQLAEMTSSREILDAVVVLKTMFPTQVHLLLGNHDSVASNDKILQVMYDYPGEAADYESVLSYFSRCLFEQKLADSDIDKGVMTGKKAHGKFVPQALIFLLQLFEDLKAQGHDKATVLEIAGQYQAFLDGCPLATIVEGKEGSVYMAHSAVVGQGLRVNRQKLVNARHDAKLMHQLLWNKQKDGDYDVSDFMTTVSDLELPGDAHVISGHEKHGKGRWKYWPFADPGHWIVHGNVNESFGLVYINNGEPTEIDLTQYLHTPEQKASA